MSAAAADAVNRNPNVAFVEEDQEVFAIGTQTMDAAGDPWGLDRIDARTGLSSTYSYTQTGSGVRVYILDSGIRTTHTEFGGRATAGMTSIADGSGTDDCNGHGTHVAGTVGGATYGVAKNVQLVAVRVLGCNGSGSWSGVIAGVDWVTANADRPAVANMSLSGGGSAAVDLAIANSIASGVTYAVAAGNGNNAGVAQNACNYSPARVGAALTIGATTRTDAKTSWSNYGSCVDWFAPGSGIKSAWHLGDNSANTISGTSMATPHTAGVAALYLEANPLTAITLTVASTKTKGVWTATLTWGGATTSAVNVFRNGALLRTIANTGTTSDSGRGGGTFTYQVCEAASGGACSNSVTISP
jgi:subtilisin family serine protease